MDRQKLEQPSLQSLILFGLLFLPVHKPLLSCLGDMVVTRPPELETKGKKGKECDRWQREGDKPPITILFLPFLSLPHGLLDQHW